ncbi:metal ABC transporter substrate-binding protein [Sanguibacter sp. A247]|uniref:metal ABC transporter substrate-binding protein n=1 Tax=unclassified Sanguibacter TaxID=2645534 RepID=UPI003FD761A2
MSFSVPSHARRTALVVTALVPAAALALAACTAAPADDGRISVLSSFYPLHYVAQQVGGDRVHVTNLTPPGGEPHDLELAPAVVRDIRAADLVVYQSGFQPAVDQAVADGAPQRTLDATAVLEAAPPATPALPRDAADDHAADDHEADDHAAHDETADDDHAPHDETTDDGHGHDGPDPHFWLDPTRLALLAPAMADALSAADPAGAEAYRTRADALVTHLTELDDAFTDGLASCTHRTIVTSHAAFGHLAARYDLAQVSVSGLDPESEPTPARLRDVAATIREAGVPTIFFESSASAKVATVLAEEVGVSTAALSPLETLTNDEVAAGADYVSVMTANLDTLMTGLACE